MPIADETSRTAQTDVIVVGLGIHGRAAALELSLRGLKVLALDQFEDGHGRGSSHGATRMIRRAYPNPVWNPLVARAFDGWSRWSDIAGTAFVTTTGGVYAHQGESGLQGPHCRAVGREEAHELMPSFALPAGCGAVYDPAAGVLAADRAMEFAARAASAGGAELSWGERMLSWAQTPRGVEVTTDRRKLTARKLVLTTGAWVGQAVPAFAGAFEVWRILTLTVAAGQPLAIPPRLGAFSVDRPEGLVFGIPDVDGRGFKVGVDAGLVWDPAVPATPPSAEEIRALGELMSGYVPGIALEGLDAVACLYTMTADKRFVLGALSDCPDVIVAAACSGHGFKFAPAVGEAVAQLCQGAERPDLQFLSPARLTG